MTIPNPAEKESVTRVETVYTGIFESISKGEFADGGRLPTEAELSLSYGVSRPTVREALSRLRLDGVVTSRRGAGSFVLRRPDRNIKAFAPIGSIADIQRCFVFRIAVESAAAGLAAELRTQKNLDEIQQAFDRLGLILEQETAVEEDILFHLAIMRASQNSYFVTTFEMITQQIRLAVNLTRSLSLGKSRARREGVQAEHREILAAIERGSSVEASEAVHVHLGNSRNRLFEGPVS
ncbi:MAG: FadR/GntR family transcriptional regulator [Holophaga sp.]|nr:FadR/GntR family transcriptional regulator [Holophaga sp.]